MISRQHLKILMCIPFFGILLTPSSILLNGYQLQEEKVNQDGKLTLGVVWNKTLNAGEYSWGISAIERQDGSIMIISREFNEEQLRIWCLAANGDPIWNISHQVPDGLTPSAVVECDDGGFLVAGTQGVISWENLNAYAFRFDNYGAMLWNVTFHQTDRQWIFDACQLISGHFLLIGEIWNSSIGDRDALLIHLNDSGNVLWNVTYGSSQYDERLDAVVPSKGGDAIALGTIQDMSHQILSEMMGIRIDINGSIIWQHTYSWTRPSEGTCIIDTEGDEFLIVGTIWESYLLTGVIMINELGQPLWNRTYNILQTPLDVTRTLDGAFIIVGVNVSISPPYYDQAVSFCINSTSEVRWQTQLFPPISWFSTTTICDNGDSLLVGTLMDETWVLRSQETWTPSTPIMLPPQVWHLMSTVVLQWLPSLDTDGFISGYRIQMTSSDNFTAPLKMWQVKGVSLVLANVSDGSYLFRLCAVDNLNATSVWSNIVSIRVSRVSMLLLINILVSSVIAIGVGLSVIYLSKHPKILKVNLS